MIAESFCRREIERALGARVVDLDQLRCRARLFERLGDDERDRLMVVRDVGAAEQLAVLQSPLPSLPAFSAVTIASTPGARLGGGDRSTRSGPWRSPAPTT